MAMAFAKSNRSKMGGLYMGEGRTGRCHSPLDLRWLSNDRRRTSISPS